MTDDRGPLPAELARPAWAEGSELLRHYYDTEWGMPVRDETGLFERICLEGFQAGLSWELILRRRPAFRAAFAGFDPDRVSGFDDADVARLLADGGIIRNRPKILATIANARATVALREDGGLVDLVWSFRPVEAATPRTVEEIPTSSPESVALAQELRRRGFRYVGPVTMYALMQAVGIVDAHLVGGPRRGASGVWPA
ncbi:MAG: DNA-3-methyladenine glycosylase I [Dermatophilaceae bacterium]